MTMDGVGEQLVRPQLGLRKVEWPDTGEVEFQLGHGDWIDLLRANGFEIERLVELFARPDAETHSYYKYVTPDWARKWPADEVWVARKASTRRRRLEADRASPGRPSSARADVASTPNRGPANPNRG